MPQTPGHSNPESPSPLEAAAQSYQDQSAAQAEQAEIGARLDAVEAVTNPNLITDRDVPKASPDSVPVDMPIFERSAQPSPAENVAAAQAAVEAVPSTPAAVDQRGPAVDGHEYNAPADGYQSTINSGGTPESRATQMAAYNARVEQPLPTPAQPGVVDKPGLLQRIRTLFRRG